MRELLGCLSCWLCQLLISVDVTTAYQYQIGIMKLLINQYIEWIGYLHVTVTMVVVMRRRACGNIGNLQGLLRLRMLGGDGFQGLQVDVPFRVSFLLGFPTHLGFQNCWPSRQLYAMQKAVGAWGSCISLIACQKALDKQRF